MSKLTKLNREQMEQAFQLLNKMWLTKPNEEFLAMPVPSQIPKNLQHLEVPEWEALSWTLNNLMEQKLDNQIH